MRTACECCATFILRQLTESASKLSPPDCCLKLSYLQVRMCVYCCFILWRENNNSYTLAHKHLMAYFSPLSLLLWRLRGGVADLPGAVHDSQFKM